MIGDAIKRTKERLGQVKRQRSTQRRQRERRDAFTIRWSATPMPASPRVQRAGQGARLRGGPAVRHARHHDAPALPRRGRAQRLAVGHGRLHPRPAARPGRGFAATLQEARDADLLLHVVDASNPEHPEQIAEVMRVLREIGADDLPQILVFNKLDLVPRSASRASASTRSSSKARACRASS